jgi:hypothetical protein
MDEFANCPFCGEPFVFAEISDPGIEVRHENEECRLYGFVGWFDNKEDAIKAMNPRPIESALRVRIAELTMPEDVLETIAACVDFMITDTKNKHEIDRDGILAECQRALDWLIAYKEAQG